MTGHATTAEFEERVHAALLAEGVEAEDAAAVRHWLHGAPPQWQPASRPGGRPDAEILPPVRLPPRSELAEAARCSPLLRDRRRFLTRHTRRCADTPDPEAAKGACPAHGEAFGRTDSPRTASDRRPAAFEDSTTDLGMPAAADSDEGALVLWQAFLVRLTSPGGRYGVRPATPYHGRHVAEHVLGALMFELYTDPVPLPLERAVAWLVNDALADALLDGAVPGNRAAQVRESANTAVRKAVRSMRHHQALFSRADGRTELTDLGRWGARGLLVRSGMVAPVLGGYADAGAAELLEILPGYSEKDRAAEFAGWRAARAPHRAATELLDAAACADGARRSLAATLLGWLGADAEGAAGAVRARRSDPRTGPHCRAWLREYGGLSEEEPSETDRAWLLADHVLGAAALYGPAECGSRLVRLLGPAQRPLLAVLAELDHPEAESVLRLLAEVHPDPRVTAAAAWLLRRRARGRPDPPGRATPPAPPRG